MNATTLERERERQDFALRAAEAFAKSEHTFTYSDGDLVAGALLALRWGLLDRGVVVIRISGDEEPVRYDGLVRGGVPA